MSKDDHTYCLILAGLWLVLFSLLAGCAAQVKDSGKAVDWLSRAKLAETVIMPIGDTGRDIDKSVTTTTVTPIRGERVTVNPLPTNALIGAAVALALLLLFVAWTINRMLAYRHGLRVLQAAIEDEGNAALIEAIKPRVRAMGHSRKRLFDKVLGRVQLG